MTTIELLKYSALNFRDEDGHCPVSHTLLEQVAAELESLTARIKELERPAKIGAHWEENSSLEEWFPITAEELARLRHDVEAYRGALGYSIPGNHDGKLSDGQTPQCGLCSSEHRKGMEQRVKELEADKERLDWLETRKTNHHAHWSEDGWQHPYSSWHINHYAKDGTYDFPNTLHNLDLRSAIDAARKQP